MALARAGAAVTLLGRDESRLLAARDAIVSAGGSATPLVCDLAQLVDVELEPADIVVHSAATFAPYAPVERSDSAAERAVLATTVHAGLELARRFLPGMRAKGWGRFVFIGSAAGHRGAAGQAAYAACKAALVGLVRSLAVEAGRDGVTCNLVDPGLIDTERTREAIEPDVQRAIIGNTALGRVGRPEEVAALVLLLASDAGGFITGAAIPVDGGLGLGIAPRPQAEENHATA